MLKKFKVDFSPTANIELNEAVDWYDLQQNDLGERFFKEFDKVISSIERNPYFASVKYDNIRVAFCKKFPFGIHYVVDAVSNTVYITSIFHQSQKPFWES